MIEIAIGRAHKALMASNAKSATVYLSPSKVVRVTRQGKIYPRASSVTVLVTVGAPNYKARDFIKLLKKAGEPFPVRKVHLTGTSKKYSRKHCR